MIALPRGAALKVIIVYWAMLAFGMALYTALRLDDFDTLRPVWIGAVSGTVLGQVLAMQRIRMWLAMLVIVSCGIMLLPQLPDDMHGANLWLAYLPAALCGYWSLGDRSSLAAFWFPAVIWMLSILDGAGASSMPDGTGIVLFAGLAALFIVYLRVREERRVSLWRTVSPTPLAVATAPILLKERPGPQLARLGWAMLVSALGFAATAWIAPRLWQPESFDGGKVRVASHDHSVGLPCCPRHDEAPVTRARVKEYFDIGRGRDQIGEPKRPGIECRVCRDHGAYRYAYNGSTFLPSEVYDANGVVMYDQYRAMVTELERNGGDIRGMTDYQAGTDGSIVGTAPSPSTNDQWGGAQRPSALVEPPAPQYVPDHYQPEPYVAPTPPAPPPPAPVRPHVAPQPPATPPPLPPPPPKPVPPPPPIATPVEPPPVIAPAPQEVPSTSGEAPAPNDDGAPPTPRPPSAIGPLVLHWAAVLIACVLLLQLAALALRPLRRFVTLRHLRKPFWDETVDQRVSNSWQLALVGLRDAGWRTSAAEPPGELAKRVNIEGVLRCATILERTRHGIGIDRDDLATMSESADLAYRSARASLGRGARFIAWIRWPLA